MPEQQDERELEWLSLDEDEHVVWSDGPRVQSMIPTLIGMLVLFPLLPFVAVWEYLRIENTDFVITSDAVYKKTGVVSRTVKKIEFDKIQNVSFNQGAFGNYFGYGTVAISTAGSSGAEMSFRYVDDPKSVQEKLSGMIKGEEEGRATSSSCPECGEGIEEDWLACPACGTRVRERCDVCDGLLETEWKFCPYCGADQRDR